MNTRSLFQVLVVAAACAVAIPAAAQQGTVVTTSGERVSGLVRDMDRSGFTVDVNGNERRIMVPQIAVVDFAGGRELSSDEVSRLRQGRQVVILKDGTALVGGVASYERTMPGALVDLPKDHAFRIHFNVEGSGERTFLSSGGGMSRIQRPPGGRKLLAARVPGADCDQGRTGDVDGTRPWTSTGITVRRGQTVRFDSSGTIQLGLAGTMSPGRGSRTGRIRARGAAPAEPCGCAVGRSATANRLPSVT